MGFGRTGGGNRPFLGGLTAGLGLTYQPGVLLFTVRTGGVWVPLHGDIVGDAAFLIGAGTRGPRSHASLAAGPALTGGELRAFHSSRTRFSSQLGLGVQVQLLALPLAEVGAGVTGFANLNRHASFGGVLFSLGFGQLR